MFTLEIYEAGQWFPTTFFSTELELALQYASERANEIGEDRTRILKDGKVFL